MTIPCSLRTHCLVPSSERADCQYEVEVRVRPRETHFRPDRPGIRARYWSTELPPLVLLLLSMMSDDALGTICAATLGACLHTICLGVCYDFITLRQCGSESL